VNYYRNGTLVYTSTVAPAYPLKVDTSLNTVGSAIYNVVISGARLTASPVNYVLQDVQGSTRAVMSGTSVIARHDFLPFGEEMAAGVGMPVRFNVSGGSFSHGCLQTGNTINTLINAVATNNDPLVNKS